MHHLLEILLNRQVPRFGFLGNAFVNSLCVYVLLAVLVDPSCLLHRGKSYSPAVRCSNVDLSLGQA